jgi:hypothetical protein
MRGTQAPAMQPPAAPTRKARGVVSALGVCAEQTPAPEQVPASVHAVEGQVVATHAPAAHSPSPVVVSSQTVLSGASASAEQRPAPEQVPATLHCAVGGGQTTPAQGSQHAAHPAAAQPSVHSSAQEPEPQQSHGRGVRCWREGAEREERERERSAGPERHHRVRPNTFQGVEVPSVPPGALDSLKGARFDDWRARRMKRIRHEILIRGRRPFDVERCDMDFDSGLRQCHQLSLHPGSIATPLLRHQGRLAAPVSAVMNVLARVSFLNWAVKSAAQGAATSVLAASARAGALPSGAYLSDCGVAAPAAAARDAALAARLWERSEELVAAAASAAAR